MSFHPQAIPSIPEETARVAHIVLPKGNSYMHMRDHLGTLYQDQDFADLFPPKGQPAEAPWRLALISIMQYAEGLTDRQAADAVRTRIDWKYALSLELTDLGFDFSLLSEFRSRLLAHGAERRLFDLLLQQCGERGWIKGRGKHEPTPPMCWQPFERSVAWNVWERRCVMRSMSWQKSLQTGSWSRWMLNGQSGIASGSAIFVCLKMPRNVSRWPKRLGQMVVGS